MAYLLTTFLLILTSWTFYLTRLPSHSLELNYLYNLGYGIFFIVASFIHLSNAKKNPLFRSFYYSASIASLGYFVGLAIWTYYNLSGLDLPYPSLADIAFICFYFFSIVGGINATKKLGGVITFSRAIESLILWGLLFTISYNFVKFNSQMTDVAPLANFLNLLYPLLDTFLLTLALMVIRSQSGRLQPSLLFLVFSFLALTLGDAIFSYQTTNNYYWNGNYVDFLFAIFSYLYAMGSLALPRLLQTPPHLKLSN